MIKVKAIYEAHVWVADLDASIAFYRDTLDLPLAHIEEERRVAFFWCGAPGHSMLGVWEEGGLTKHPPSHTAFDAGLADVLDAPRRLRAAGITPINLKREEVDEPVVLAWMPAASIYFLDPDCNLLEYIAMLNDAPHPALGVVTWSRWCARAK